MTWSTQWARVPVASISLRRAAEDPRRIRERSVPKIVYRRGIAAFSGDSSRDSLLLYILASLSQFGVTEVSPSTSCL